MSRQEIITTLHPENDSNVDLYPNIKKENIPNESIDEHKLDPNYLMYINNKFININNKFININNKIDDLEGGEPKYVDTSTNILALTENKGIAVATDTGYWYYWDGTQYISSGLQYTSPLVASSGLSIVSVDQSVQTIPFSYTNDMLNYNFITVIIGGETYLFTKIKTYLTGSVTVTRYISNNYMIEFAELGGTRYAFVSYNLIEPVNSYISLTNIEKNVTTIAYNYENNLLNFINIIITVDGNPCVFTKARTYIVAGQTITQYVSNDMLVEFGIVGSTKYIFYNINSESNVTYNDIYVGDDETYTNIKTALDSITDASYSNRYRLHIKAGTYDVPEGQSAFGLKNYVYIIGENKATCIIRHLVSNDSYNEYKNGFDLAVYQDHIVECSIENLTIITKGCKAPIHIDDNYNYLTMGGKIVIKNCILKDISTSNNIGVPWDKYGFNACGGVNVGLRDGQCVEVIDCVSNGMIYAHNVYSSNRTYRVGANFKVINCEMQSTIVGDLDSGANDNWYYENNRIRWFIINYNNSGGSSNPKWSINIDLKGNDIGRMYSVYGYLYNSNEEFKVFDELFNGKWIFTSNNIHQIVYNGGTSNILKASLVEVNDFQHDEMSGIEIKKLSTIDKLYGYALEDINIGEFGIIQYSGVIRYSVNGVCSIGDKLTFDITNDCFKVANDGDKITAISCENKVTTLTDNIEIKLLRTTL